MPFESQHLIVRHFTLDDTAVIFALSRESGMKRFIPDQVYSDEAEAAEVLSFLIGQYEKPDAVRSATYVQAVALRESGELIGHVGLSPADDEMEIGYAIAESHQGNGYATELVRETLRWALQDQGLARVLGIVASDNIGSIRVLQKAGFTLVEERRCKLHGQMKLVRRYEATQ